MTSPSKDKEPSVASQLVRAASTGDLSAVKALLDAGADVNCLNEGGQTALILASVMGHAEVVAHLIEAGADPQLRDHLNLTAVEWSIRRGFSDVTKLLTNVSPPRPPAMPVRTPESAKTTEKKSSANITGDPEPAKPAPATVDATELTTTTRTETSAESQAPERQPELVEILNAEVAEPVKLAAESTVAPLLSAPSPPEPVVKEAEAPSISLEAESAPWPTSEPTPQISDPNIVAVAAPTELQPPGQKPVAAASVSTPEPPPISEEDETLPQPGAVVSNVDITLPKATPIAAPPDSPMSAPAVQTPALNRRAAGFSGSFLGLSASATDDDEPQFSNKRCPKCGTVYENTPLLYCTRDYIALIDNESFPSLAAPEVLATPDPISAHAPATTPIVVWFLIAFVLVASAFAAYRVTQYLFRPEAPAPIVAKSEATPMKEKPFFTVAGALAGMELNVPRPEYPAEIQDAGITGPITVNIRVNKNGRVVSAVSSNGDQRLRAAAVKAAKQATFAPDKLAEISPRGRVVRGSITYELAAPQTNGATAPTTTATAENDSANADTSAPNSDPNAPVVGDELASAAKTVPAADYPSRAMRAGIGGTITVTIRVNRAGKVTSWRSSAGDSQLRAASIKAARRATFSPDKLPGNGDVLGTITYNFKP